MSHRGSLPNLFAASKRSLSTNKNKRTHIEIDSSSDSQPSNHNSPVVSNTNVNSDVGPPLETLVNVTIPDNVSVSNEVQNNVEPPVVLGSGSVLFESKAVRNFNSYVARSDYVHMFIPKSLANAIEQFLQSNKVDHIIPVPHSSPSHTNNIDTNVISAHCTNDIPIDNTQNVNVPNQTEIHDELEFNQMLTKLSTIYEKFSHNDLVQDLPPHDFRDFQNCRRSIGKWYSTGLNLKKDLSDKSLNTLVNINYDVNPNIKSEQIMDIIYFHIKDVKQKIRISLQKDFTLRLRLLNTEIKNLLSSRSDDSHDIILAKAFRVAVNSYKHANSFKQFNKKSHEQNTEIQDASRGPYMYPRPKFVPQYPKKIQRYLPKEDDVVFNDRPNISHKSSQHVRRYNTRRGERDPVHYPPRRNYTQKIQDTRQKNNETISFDTRSQDYDDSSSVESQYDRDYPPPVTGNYRSLKRVSYRDAVSNRYHH
jgi:hypothetical protein